MKLKFFVAFSFFSCLIAAAQPVNLTPPKRAHHCLVYDDSKKAIVMTAGSTPLDSGRSSLMYNDVWTFDGTSWKMVGTAGDERSGIALA